MIGKKILILKKQRLIEETKEFEEILDLFSDKKSMKILKLLFKKPKSVKEIHLKHFPELIYRHDLHYNLNKLKKLELISVDITLPKSKRVYFITDKGKKLLDLLDIFELL